jgi:SAM-dependent methyltransferase
MEYLSFGNCLMYLRQLRIPEMQHHRRVLVYGDGDGRFLARLMRRAPALRVTAVDASARMLQVAAHRLPPGASVELVHADALAFHPSRECGGTDLGYDLIVSHFFLDCFSEDELSRLVERVNAAAAESTVWIVSDFAIPDPPIARVLGRWIVRGLYRAFRLLVGLKTRRLPDHASVLRRGGWLLRDRRERLCGLLISERWSRHAGARTRDRLPGEPRMTSNGSAARTLPLA